jgi:uncharacterized protein (DUF983 family)
MKPLRNQGVLPIFGRPAPAGARERCPLCGLDARRVSKSRHKCVPCAMEFQETPFPGRGTDHREAPTS